MDPTVTRGAVNSTLVGAIVQPDRAAARLIPSEAVDIIRDPAALSGRTWSNMPAPSGSRTSKTSKAETPAPAAPAADRPSLPETGARPTVLESLLELAARQRQLEAFRERAEERRDKVDPAVYARVLADYQARLAALRAEAAPLKRQLRADYDTLQASCARLRQRLDQARLDKEELEFRRELGELDQQAFEERVEAPAGVVAECEAELAGLEAQGARFLEALGGDVVDGDEGDTAVTGGMPVSDAPAQAPAGAPPPATPAAAVPAPAAAMPDLDPEATVLGVTQFLPPDALAEAPPSAHGDDDDAGQTIIMPDATLTIQDSGQEAGAPVEYRLAAFNYLGRAEGNQVQLTRGGVSRRHALIALAGPRGYSIKDLQSQNGTFVNGERIEEVLLADGDRITVGDAELTFRLSPPR
jgi:hypothetical protein